MFNWLGTWLGGWFGSGDPAPPGSMSGVASVSISTVATLTSTGSAPGMMSGTAALAISTTATSTHTAPVATGNFWADGFWSAGFWADGFWGVFEQPYTELKPNLKMFVLAELSKVFVQFEVEQIIAVAELNSLSVLDAASALSLTVNVENNRLVATHHAHNLRAFVESADVTARPSSLKAITAKQQHSQLAVTSRQESIYIAQKTHASTFVRTLPNTLTSRRKRVIQST